MRDKKKKENVRVEKINYYTLNLALIALFNAEKLS